MLRTSWWRTGVLGVTIACVLAGAPAAGWTQGDRVGLDAAGIDGPALGISPEIVVSDLDNEKFLPVAAYNSKHNEYLVVWHNKWGSASDAYRDIYAQRVSATGELKSWFAVAALGNSRAQAGVAYDPVNDRYLVVWAYDVAGNGSNWDIYGRFVPWNEPGNAPEFAICDWPSSQWNPEVVYAQTQQEFLVVWTNTPSGVPAYISARRVVAADGSLLPPNKGFTIASHLTEQRVHPDVAYNLARNEYMVVYDNTTDVFGIRLKADGVSLGGEFPIAGWPDAEDEPAVTACAGVDQYLVVWQSATASLHEIYGYFLNGDGTQQKVQHIFGTVVDEESPEVACDATGRNYLVVWEQQYSSATGPKGVTGRRVHTDSSMEKEFAICPPSPTADRTSPTVTAGRVNLLAVWEHQRGNTAFQDIHARLVYMERMYLPALAK